MSLHPALLPTAREPRPAGAVPIGELNERSLHPPAGREGQLGRAVPIGELNERSLHRALKARYAVGGGATEQAVDGFVADVVAGGRIVEVHTGSFRPLKRKLPRLLERYPVTLVHPVARDRYIVKMPPDPSAPPSRRKSPKHGSVFEVFTALVSIPALLAHPNLTLEVVMTVEDEVRARTGAVLGAAADHPDRPSWRRRDPCHPVDERPVRPARRRSPEQVTTRDLGGGMGSCRGDSVGGALCCVRAVSARPCLTKLLRERQAGRLVWRVN